MPRCDITAGHYYSQLITTAHSSCHFVTSQQLPHSVSMGSMLDAAYNLETTAIVLQTTT